MLHHLGCDFGRDDDGTLHLSPHKCVKKMIGWHFNVFWSKPKLNFMWPLEKDDYPELDTSERLDQESMQKYQSLIGAIQWTCSLGMLDINTEVMNLDSFRADRSKRVISYLVKFKHATIRTRKEEPDSS